MNTFQADSLLTEALKKRILILDGAFGSLIQSLGLKEADYRGQRFENHPLPLKGNGDILVLSKPEVISDIHRRYLEAGADIIKTNTFISNRISQSDYGTDSLIAEMNRSGAQLARKMADRFSAMTPEKPRFVAGSIGPTNKSCSLSPRVDEPGFREVAFDDMVAVYREAAAGLLQGGVDLFLIETIFDTLNAKAALWAIERLFEESGKKIPVMISATVSDQSGRTLTGQTIEAFTYSIRHSKPFSIGLNCSLGIDQMIPHIRELARISEFPLSLHPNAGLPDEMGNYTQSAEYMGGVLARLGDEGLINIAGGCCGTTPEHIAAIARNLAGKAPRQTPPAPLHCRLSGLDPLTIDKNRLFVNIGERTNVAGSARFARLIREKKYDKALSVARSQVENGAQIIDINLDDPLLDAPREMSHFLNLVASEPDVARVPVMIDSSRWEVIEAGLKCLQGKGIVNSISLKEGEEQFLKRAQAIHSYGAAMVVMAFDEQGQADSTARKTAICQRAYTLLTEKAGIPPEDIIFDVNIFAIGTGMSEHDRYALDFIEAVAWIKKNLPQALTSGGVSNLSFSFRGQDTIREALHSVFLYHAIKAGLDMAIVNPGQLALYTDLSPELREAAQDLVLCRRSDATERLLAIAKHCDEEKSGPETSVQNSWRTLPLAERLSHALVSGQTDHLTEDLDQAQREGISGLSLVEGPLMNGMNEVGSLFGEGKMFLPQVVKSARVMKQAVDHLRPGIEAELGQQAASKPRATILLATVKGDVHDIGKNIVKVVLQCNNYRVVDLGVMVPAQEIIQKAKEESVDMIGLSGLITPSLEEMVSVAQAMKREGLKIPLLIGGATTSAQHTAIKIAPMAADVVVHIRDASQAVMVANRLSGPDAQAAKAGYQNTQIRAANAVLDRKMALMSLQEAREKRLELDWAGHRPSKPNKLGVYTIEPESQKDVEALIDWRFFLKAWEMPATMPEDIPDKTQQSEALALIQDAKTMLRDIEESKLLVLKGVYGLFAAHSLGDDVLVFRDDKRQDILTAVHFLRQQKIKHDESASLCLADFVAPAGKDDYLGAFAVSVQNTEALVAKLSAGDSFREIMIKVLCDRLAEAMAEWLHREVRTRYWGYAAEEKLSLQELLAGKYQGIRPAPGYPPCPDHLEKESLLNTMLNAGEQLGIRLTERMMMIPVASVCGYYFSDPRSRYFSVGPIGKDQLEDYASRKKTSQDDILPFLANEVRRED